MARYHIHYVNDDRSRYDLDRCDLDCPSDDDHVHVFTDDELTAALDRARHDATVAIYGTFYPTVPYGSARQHDSPAY